MLLFGLLFLALTMWPAGNKNVIACQNLLKHSLHPHSLSTSVLHTSNHDTMPLITLKGPEIISVTITTLFRIHIEMNNIKFQYTEDEKAPWFDSWLLVTRDAD